MEVLVRIRQYLQSSKCFCINILFDYLFVYILINKI
nr:MAG TPA: hypothetical protein [Caudoviricetes sp.]